MTTTDPADAAIALFISFARDIDDPRAGDPPHTLINVLVIALCALLCGANDLVEVAEFADARRDLLARWLDLGRAGVPSEATLRRVLGALAPSQVARAMTRWAAALATAFGDEVVAVDGKAVAGAFDAAARTVPLHLVHVWATRQRLLLAQTVVAGAPGEPGAIPALLRALDLRGAFVTVDANTCTPPFAAAVLAAGGGWAATLKANRAPQHAAVAAAFAAADAAPPPDATRHRTEESGHGRREIRVLDALPAAAVAAAPALAAWRPYLGAIVRVTRTREVGCTVARETTYVLTSARADAAALAPALRAHWCVENDLHATLDVYFGEDACRVRDLQAAAVLATLRRLALMLLQRTPSTPKRSLKAKRYRAALDDAFLLHILRSGVPAT